MFCLDPLSGLWVPCQLSICYLSKSPQTILQYKLCVNRIPVEGARGTLRGSLSRAYLGVVVGIGHVSGRTSLEPAPALSP